MKRVVLDFNGCRYLDEIHQRIQEALGFPEYYGKNLDALWDSLHVDCDVDFVTIVGSSKVTEKLQPTVQDILEILEENKKYWADSECPFDYEVMD